MKAQIAMEYLILTSFILVAVGILFSFSFLNYSQNIQIIKSNETVSKLENAVNDVYTKGEGNTRFVNLSLPEAMQNIQIIHKCVGTEPSQGTLVDCGNSYDNVEFSAIAMDISLLGGTSTIIRQTKAKISEDIGDIASGDYAGSAYIVKVSWNDLGRIKLEKV